VADHPLILPTHPGRLGRQGYGDPSIRQPTHHPYRRTSPIICIAVPAAGPGRRKVTAARPDAGRRGVDATRRVGACDASRPGSPRRCVRCADDRYLGHVFGTRGASSSHLPESGPDRALASLLACGWLRIYADECLARGLPGPVARPLPVSFSLLRGWTAPSWLHGRAGCPLIHFHCG
jgi:hypothetical protein